MDQRLQPLAYASPREEHSDPLWAVDLVSADRKQAYRRLPDINGEAPSALSSIHVEQGTVLGHDSGDGVNVGDDARFRC